MRPVTRKTILFTILLGIVAVLVLDSRDKTPAQRSASPIAAKRTDAGPPSEGAQERAGRYALPDRAALGAPQAQLFGPQSWQPPAPTRSAAPAAPQVPAMPYRYAGKVLHEGQTKVFLAKGEKVFSVRTGDTLDGAYRVQSIANDKITLVYLPLGRTQTIPVNSALPLAATPIGPAAATGSSAVGASAARKAPARSAALAADAKTRGKVAAVKAAVAP